MGVMTPMPVMTTLRSVFIDELRYVYRVPMPTLWTVWKSLPSVLMEER